MYLWDIDGFGILGDTSIALISAGQRHFGAVLHHPTITYRQDANK
jgi:hypothetical protein